VSSPTTEVNAGERQAELGYELGAGGVTRAGDPAAQLHQPAAEQLRLRHPVAGLEHQDFRSAALQVPRCGEPGSPAPPTTVSTLIRSGSFRRRDLWRQRAPGQASTAVEWPPTTGVGAAASPLL
jgi:hypothetical protein